MAKTKQNKEHKVEAGIGWHPHRAGLPCHYPRSNPGTKDAGTLTLDDRSPNADTKASCVHMGCL